MTMLAGHVTYILIALSYLLRDILWLRWAALIASACSVVFNYFAPAAPLWIPIFWNVLFIAINAYHIAKLLRRSNSDLMRAEEIELARTFLCGASPHQLSELFEVGEWRDLNTGDVLAREGTRCEQISVLYEGEVQIMLDGRVQGIIQEQTFVGEISFLTGENASATVVVTQPSKALVWSMETLTKILSRDEQLNAQFQKWLAVDVVRKLSRREDELVGV
jgi:CRP-like cAMP-binding protein